MGSKFPPSFDLENVLGCKVFSISAGFKPTHDRNSQRLYHVCSTSCVERLRRRVFRIFSG